MSGMAKSSAAARVGRELGIVPLMGMTNAAPPAYICDRAYGRSCRQTCSPRISTVGVDTPFAAASESECRRFRFTRLRMT